MLIKYSNPSLSTVRHKLPSGLASHSQLTGWKIGVCVCVAVCVAVCVCMCSEYVERNRRGGGGGGESECLMLVKNDYTVCMSGTVIDLIDIHHFHCKRCDINYFHRKRCVLT